MDEIRQFKENGNGAYVKYSPKELIEGLHVKIDNNQKSNLKILNEINSRLSDGDKRIAKIETHITWLKIAVIALYTFLGTILTPLRKFFGFN